MMLSKFKWTALFGAVFSVILWGSFTAGFSQSPQPSIQLITEPPIAQILPFEAEATTSLGTGKLTPPVQLSLRAIDATGNLLPNARFHLQILTPARTPWFTTDFPMAEGASLLEIEGDAPTGEFQVQQVFPIRGTYQLVVEVTPIANNAFTPIQQTLNLTVPENPIKYRYLSILVVALLGAGFIGGWVMGGQQPSSGKQPSGEPLSGETVPQRVRLLLSGMTIVAIAALLFINITAEMTEAHGHEHGHEPATVADLPDTAQSQQLELKLSGDSNATVGQLASLKVKLTNRQTNQPVTNAIFTIKAIQLEDHWVAFAHNAIPNAQGEATWQQQFFDGAPHTIEVTASSTAQPTFQPLQVAKEIEVEGVAPPLWIRLLSLAYLTGILLVGVLVGFWFKRQPQPWFRA
jgi:hypothetical protein